MFDLTDEQRDIQRLARDFAQNEVKPIAEEIDRDHRFPYEVIAKAADIGLMGIPYDEQYGGGGADNLSYALAVEELARIDSSVAITICAHISLGTYPIYAFGSDEQKAELLPDLCSGKKLWSFGLTEPEAGSDSQAMKTRAEQKAGGWVLNGRKHYISGAHVADVVMIMAVTDAAKRGRGGITAFLVDKGTPGFKVTRVDTTIGSEAIKLAELTLEECFVPDSAVLGEVGQGFKIAMESLTSGRLGVSCSCLGAADRLIEMSAQFARERVTFGQPLSERQAIQWMIADSVAELETARAYTYETLRRVQAGENVGPAASICKLTCSEMVGRVADRAVQIHGGMGLVKGYPVERFYRDVRHYRVGEGSSEIQRMLIARDLLR